MDPEQMASADLDLQCFQNKINWGSAEGLDTLQTLTVQLRSSGARVLIFSLYPYLLSYFVYTCSKDSDETETKQTCLSLYCWHMQFVPKSCVDSTIQ